MTNNKKIAITLGIGAAVGIGVVVFGFGKKKGVACLGKYLRKK